MKRDPALKPLSEEHHLALVLARAAKRAAAEGTGLEKVWAQVAEEYPEQLDPHFRIEEETLSPALQAAGEQALVERLLEDHRKLRALVLGADRSREALRAFGELLDAHVRFEERELFNRAQDVLGSEELTRVFDACRRRKA